MTDRFLHEHTAAPGHATNAAREIGPVDGSMTAADVKAALSMRWPDDRYLVDLDTGSTIAWPADQPIERQVRRP